MSSEGELGNLGEPPVSLSYTRIGGPGDQRPWRDRELPPDYEPVGETTNDGSRQGIGERATSEGPRDGEVAVVAAHSTEEGGEVRPKRPTGGKAPSSRASAGRTQGRDFELTNPDHGRPVDCGARVSLHGQQWFCLRNRMRDLRTSGSVGGPGG